MWSGFEWIFRPKKKVTALVEDTVGKGKGLISKVKANHKAHTSLSTHAMRYHMVWTMVWGVGFLLFLASALARSVWLSGFVVGLWLFLKLTGAIENVSAALADSIWGKTGTNPVRDREWIEQESRRRLLAILPELHQWEGQSAAEALRVAPDVFTKILSIMGGKKAVDRMESEQPVFEESK